MTFADGEIIEGEHSLFLGWRMAAIIRRREGYHRYFIFMYASGQEARVFMEQVTETKRHFHISPRMGTTLGIIVIALAVIGTLISGPHEKEHDSLFSGEPTATVVVTNSLGQQPVKQSLTYESVNVNITQVLLATRFSDDIKTEGNVGKYTLRVMINTKNSDTGTQTIGVDYARLIQVILPNGQKIAPKLVSVDAVEYPGRAQSGFVDFPLNQPVSLSGLKFQFAQQIVPLSA